MIETVDIDRVVDDIFTRRLDRDHLTALKEQIIYSKNYVPIKVTKKDDHFLIAHEGPGFVTLEALRELGYTKVRIEVQNG